MKRLIIITAIFVGLLFASTSLAATAELLQPASDITYNENLIVNGYGDFNSIRIGEEGVGGVTYFNGTIVNIGEYVPVTFGDDVRIDGQIWGGPNKGNANDQALKIADTLMPALTNANDLGSNQLRWRDFYVKNINLSGDLVGDQVVDSQNIKDSSIQGSDIKNQTLQGQHINREADLNISQLYAADGIVSSDDIIVSGKVDGVDLSEENMAWYHDSSASLQINPARNKYPSKIFAGATDMPLCPGPGPISKDITLPEKYTSTWSYIANATEWVTGPLSHGIFEHVYVTNVARDIVRVVGICRGGGFSTTVSFNTIGY